MPDPSVFVKFELAIKQFGKAFEEAGKIIGDFAVKFANDVLEGLGYIPIKQKQTLFEQNLTRLHNKHLCTMDKMNPENIDV